MTRKSFLPPGNLSLLVRSFRLPSCVSLNQEESRSSVAASGSPLAASAALTVEVLEKWKESVLSEIRQEIVKAKSEIIEALRSELQLQR